VLDAGRPEANVVPRIRFLNADVVCDPQALFVCFLLHHLHDVPVDPQQLDAVDTLRLE
jgi:hypothetical protein